MNKLNIVLSVIVVILLVIVSLVFWKPNFLNSFTAPSYYAVYMITGDLYFGKMSWFTPHTLSDVRMIQRDQKDEKAEPTLSLVEFNKSVVWGPTGDLKLNEKNISWISKLSNESQVVQLINKK